MEGFTQLNSEYKGFPASFRMWIWSPLLVLIYCKYHLTVARNFFQALLQVKEALNEDLGREPSDAELADATNMSVMQLRRNIEVGHAARNKLIKVSLFIRVLFSGTIVSTLTSILNYKNNTATTNELFYNSLFNCRGRWISKSQPKCGNFLAFYTNKIWDPKSIANITPGMGF